MQSIRKCRGSLIREIPVCRQTRQMLNIQRDRSWCSVCIIYPSNQPAKPALLSACSRCGDVRGTWWHSLYIDTKRRKNTQLNATARRSYSSQTPMRQRHHHHLRRPRRVRLNHTQQSRIISWIIRNTASSSGGRIVRECVPPCAYTHA